MQPLFLEKRINGMQSGMPWRGADRSRKNITVKMADLYAFRVDATVEDVEVFKSVKERVKQQTRVWWTLEASKGAGWYLRPDVSSLAPTTKNPMAPSFSFSAFTDALQLKKLVRKGVPPALRPKVWMALSGAAKKRSMVPDTYYKDLTQAVEGRDTHATRQIDHDCSAGACERNWSAYSLIHTKIRNRLSTAQLERLVFCRANLRLFRNFSSLAGPKQDLARTFPSHPWLDTPSGHAVLRRVLVAYSFRDSHVGYCQGMNYVAALLLLVMKTEEEAFWMLATLIEDVLFKDCYTSDLSGCHVEQRVFKDLLIKKCPRLAAHLELVGFDVSLVITEWFLCLFAKTLPSETTMRIWDVLFNEGVRVLFRGALAIFKMKEEQLLLAEHVGDVMSVFQSTTHHLFDPDALLKVAFEKLGSMTISTIAKHRNLQQIAVTEELQRRVQRLNSLHCKVPQLPLSSSSS